MLDPQQIKIVFFDIDETLYIKNQKTLPASVHTALEGLKRNNIIPAIVFENIFPNSISTLL